MTTHPPANRSRRPLATISAVLISSVLLAGCITNDDYARQICLEKGVTDGTGAYSDCVTAQKAWIEEWQNRSFSKPNG